MNKFAYVLSWIPLGVAVTLLSLIVYGVVQQAIRLGANELPKQMAEDAATDIVRGITPKAVIPKVNVDMAASLAPFMIVYDDRGSILATSVELDGKVPELPVGVLASARERRVDNVTWQPKPGVRSAVSIVRYVGDKPGFVLAGRSLRQIEILEDKILLDVIIGWAVTMAATLFAYYLLRR